MRKRIFIFVLILLLLPCFVFAGGCTGKKDNINNNTSGVITEPDNNTGEKEEEDSGTHESIEKQEEEKKEDKEVEEKKDETPESEEKQEETEEKTSKKDFEIGENNWTRNDDYTLELKGNELVSNQNYVVNIEKKAGQDFIILNLADLQLSDSDWEMKTSEYVTATTTARRLIESVKPDLITLTGDQGYGQEKNLANWINFLDSFEIPWAPVFGNHDCNENDCTIAYQAKMYSESKYCLFKAGPTNLGKTSENSTAIGNYIVNIYEKDSSSDGFHVVNSLIMLNTRDKQDYSSSYYQTNSMKSARYLSDDWASWTYMQLGWYKWAVKGVQKYGNGGKTKSTIIMHIPNYDYITAFFAAFNCKFAKGLLLYNLACYKVTVNESYNDDSVWNEGYKDSEGVRHENGGSAPYPDGVLDAILDFDNDKTTDFVSTSLVIAGHDHQNNFIVNYMGVKFAYALKTGSGCYWEEDLNGGSIITVSSDGNTSIEHKYIEL